MANTYLTEFELVVRQAISRWNRDPASPSRGSFDRKFWGWKFKDFSDATLQYAVKPALEYFLREGTTEVIPAWLTDYVRFLQAIQLADGSFNQCYPFERTPGVVYDVFPALISVHQSPYLTSQDRHALEGIIQRALDYVLRSEEKHGEIANHIASYAYALFLYDEHYREARARRRGEDYLVRLLALMDKNEGWFQEYRGPDPGYQTRTMRYLAKCALLLNAPEIWEALQKSADFMEATLMPDGSVHPMLGTRATALLYPSGFEVLGAHEASYLGLARRVRSAWDRGLVPLPSWLDFDNAIRLADDALDAAEAVQAQAQDSGGGPVQEPPEEAYALSEDLSGPPETGQTVTDFSRAGIMIVRHPRYRLYLGYRLGGVVIVYGRHHGHWDLLHEDSGYLLRVSRGEQSWVTRQPDSGRLVASTRDRLVVQAGFFQSLHDELTPWRFLLLRCLNLTILRSQWLGDVFRRIVVRHLMTARQQSPYTLRREIRLTDETITVNDHISPKAGSPGAPPGSLFFGRRITGMHMASARYFQSQELKALPVAWLQEVRWSGPGEAHQEVTIPLG